MRKKFASILVAILTAILFLTSCGNSSNAPVPSSLPTATSKVLVLNSEIIEEIKRKESLSATQAALTMTFHDLQDLKLLKDEKTDNSSYTFTYQMTFDNGKSSNAKVIYTALEDSEAEKGYTLKRSFSFK